MPPVDKPPTGKPTDKETVRLERMGDVGLILVDHPPVNALSQAVRKGLIATLARVMQDATLRAAVITCEGRTFIAGADIREFDRTSTGEPTQVTTQDIVRTLDASLKPVVAAIHGTALGGRFEVALACHSRIIAPDAFVGLPEVRIGIIPVAGGTQRLPRLVGPLVALEVITSGRHVPADEAMALGLVDEVVTDLRRAAADRALYLAESGHKPRVADRAVPEHDRAALEVAAATVKRRARGGIALVRAARAIEAAPSSLSDLNTKQEQNGYLFHEPTLKGKHDDHFVPRRDLFFRKLAQSDRLLGPPIDDDMALEAAINQELRTGLQSRALRHIFRAERVAARMPPGAMSWPLRRIGVIGGGTMGSGIAAALAEAGLEVTLVEVNEPAAAEARVRAIHDRQLRTGWLAAQSHAERSRRIAFRHHLRALHDADLVIKAVIEDLAAKQSVFRAVRHRAARRGAGVQHVLSRHRPAGRRGGCAGTGDRRAFLQPRACDAPAGAGAHLTRAPRSAGDRAGPGAPAAQGRGGGAVHDGFIGNHIFYRWRLQFEYALEDGAIPA
jgi:3-hydroxyacyl-CoA dehydrogenase